MINLPAFRAWLEREINRVQSADLQLSARHNDIPPKPGTVVEIEGTRVAATFAIWETGEADYDIMLDRDFVGHRWGMRLNDDQIPAAFKEFLQEVFRAENTKN
jgi:hypothetical protein